MKFILLSLFASLFVYNQAQSCDTALEAKCLVDIDKGKNICYA